MARAGGLRQAALRASEFISTTAAGPRPLCHSLELPRRRIWHSQDSHSPAAQNLLVTAIEKALRAPGPDFTMAPPAERPASVMPATDSIADRYRRQEVRRAWHRDLIDIVGVLMAVVPVAIYLGQGGASDLGSLLGLSRSLGAVTGLVGTALLIEMMFLAARIPFVDAAIGHDRALGRHKALTMAAFTLLFCHGLLLVAAYGAGVELGIVDEFFELWGIRDFALAVIGFGLMLIVGLSSVVAVKTKLPYEVWWLIHLVSYLAVAISLPHQFSMSGLFAAGPARWYWIVFIGSAGLAMLCFRVLYPLINSLDHRMRVGAVERADPTTVNIWLSGRKMSDVRIAAGQFCHWRFLAPGLWWHQHPFSVSSSVRGDAVRITVRNLGAGTAVLQHVRVGTPVIFEGPYGIFSDRSRTREDLVLLGAGAGIGPIRALLDETLIRPGRAMVVLRASRPEELILLDEFRAICTAKGIRLVTLVGRRAASGARWSCEQYPRLRLSDLAPWIAGADVFICGPQAWTDHVIDEANACGVADNQIHDERFVW